MASPRTGFPLRGTRHWFLATEVEGGGDKTSELELSHLPTEAVTVAVTSDDAEAARASRAHLTFTTSNWDTGQAVTVAPQDDTDRADESVTITHTASGADEYSEVSSSLEAQVEDDDSVSLQLSASELDLDEGGDDATYTARLSHEPAASVTVTVSSDDTGAATVSPLLYPGLIRQVNPSFFLQCRRTWRRRSWCST